MNKKLVSAGSLTAMFIVLATTSGWIANVNAQGSSSTNNTQSADTETNSTSGKNMTTSTGIGTSIPTPSITGNESGGAVSNNSEY